MRIALVTCAQLPQLTEEDQRLAAALSEHGHQVSAVVWDESISWDEFHILIVRSTWDYHKRIPQFLDWLQQVEHLNLHNQAQTLRWNYKKTYLQRFEHAGFQTIPTEWFNSTDQPDLSRVLSDRGWTSAILKPVVGATAFQTFKIEANNVQDLEGLKGNYPYGFMVQQYMPQISTQGEWSHVFFDKTYSHSVLKTAKKGDFRVQGDFGGRKQLLDVSTSYIKQCQQIVDFIHPVPLYARIDGLHIDDKLYIMEVELIEPELFLWNKEITDRFVTAIERRAP